MCRQKENLCEAVDCIAAVPLKIKFIDTNNKDLLFSAGANYSIADLKIKSSLDPQEIPFRVDSTDKNNKLIVISLTGSQILSLKLANRPADIIDLETSLKAGGCCGVLEITSLKANQSLVCTACSASGIITFIK